MIGTTKATELLVPGALKSVFVAMHTCYRLEWLKVINNSSIDTAEYISAMGVNSTNLVAYVTSSANSIIPLIFKIKKLDGSID